MRSLIGIDIGTSLVKVVHFEQAQRLLLKQAFIFPVPLTGKGNFSLDRGEFARHLTGHIPLHTLKKSAIAVNFPASLVNMLLVNLPKFRNRKEIETAVCSEAKRKMVPVPGPDSVFEFMIMGETAVAKIARYEVMVAKSEKHHVNGILELFAQFGDIHPLLITPSYCTVPFFLSPDRKNAQQDTLFTNIGYGTMDISIVRDNMVYLSRSVNFGLKDMVGHISTTLDKPFEKTMEIVSREGVPEVDFDLEDKVKVAEEIMRQKYEQPSGSTKEDRVNLLELRTGWETEIERIVHEIRRTLIFYKDQSQSRRVDHLFFYGGGAQIKGIVPALQKKLSGINDEEIPYRTLGIHVRKEVEPYIKENQAALVPACSLAYYLSLSKRKTIINFLPLTLKKKDLIVRSQVTALVVAFVIAAVLFLGWVTLLANIGVYQRDAEWLEFEMGRSQRVIMEIDSLKKEQRESLQRDQLVARVSGRAVDMPKVLSGVAAATPEEVIIEDVSIKSSQPAASTGSTSSQGGRFNMPQPGPSTVQSTASAPVVSIKAFSHADYESACADAVNFQKALEGGGIFRNVQVVLPDLEEISPVFENEKDVSLTEERDRSFSLEAEVVIDEDI